MEFWCKHKFSRFINGELVSSRIIHTVTGANVYIGQSVVVAPVPSLDFNPDAPPWPLLKKWDPATQALLKKGDVDFKLQQVWLQVLEGTHQKKRLPFP